MRKKSHIKLACVVFDEIDNVELDKYKFYFKVGSILPDMVPTFLWKKHRIDVTEREFKRSVYNFLNSKYHGRLYSIRAGIITHYLSDYFTYPHNKECHWGLWTHNSYEGRQMRVLKNLQSIHELIDINLLNINNLNDMFIEIKKLHEEYLNKVQKVINPIEIDLYYIEYVSYIVMNFLIENSMNFRESYSF